MSEWALPADENDERAMEKVLAENFRAEAEMFKDLYYDARDSGESAELLQALAMSRMSAIQKAAAIERKLRRI